MLPGPSAVTTALVASGLPVDRWRFEGFLPRRAGELERVLSSPETVVAFESPRRLPASLSALAALAPDRQAAVCRELTKLHEEVARGTLGELARRFRDEVKGEIVVVIAPASARAAGADLGFAVDALRRLVQSGRPPASGGERRRGAHRDARERPLPGPHRARSARVKTRVKRVRARFSRRHRRAIRMPAGTNRRSIVPGREESDASQGRTHVSKWVERSRRAPSRSAGRATRIAEEQGRLIARVAGFGALVVADRRWSRSLLFGGDDGQQVQAPVRDRRPARARQPGAGRRPADRHGRRHHAHRRRPGAGRRSPSTSRCTRAPPRSSARPRSRGSPTATSRSRPGPNSRARDPRRRR